MSFYDDASWLLVPSGIKEDVVYAQKPTSGLGDLNFQRASDATYTDSTGVVRRSPYNLLTWSEMFSDVAWTKFNSLITANVTAAPNGTLTADKLALAVGIDPLSANSTGLFQTQTITSGVYNYSIYLKASERNIARWRDGGFSGNYLVVNLTNGTFTNGEPSRFVNPQVVFAGNGWWRVSFTTGTITNSNAYPLRFGDTGQTGDGVSGGFVWGAQLVEGTSALDYFPTTNRQDVPRIDFRNADGTLSSCGRLLLEPQRTNSIRNSSMVGAVAGTPGTLPTIWNQSGGGGLTTTISLGTESGLPYVDIRYNGTATQAFLELRFEANNGIAALNGQTWTMAQYIKAISGTIPVSQLAIIERNAASGFITQGSSSFLATSSLQRLTFTRTLAGGATVAFVQPLILFSLTVGVAYDFTIRIAAPQMELGAYATTWVPTTTAAVTRLADTASKTGVSSLIGQTEGTLFVELTVPELINAGGEFSISNGTDIVNIQRPTSANNRIRSVVFIGGAFPVTIDRTITTGGTYKVAFAYKQNDFVVYVNGILVGTDTSGNVPTMDRLYFTAPFQPAQAALFKTRLDNATLAQLTTL